MPKSSSIIQLQQETYQMPRLKDERIKRCPSNTQNSKQHTSNGRQIAKTDISHDNTKTKTLSAAVLSLCFYCFSHLSSTNDKHSLSSSFLNVRICSLTLSAKWLYVLDCWLENMKPCEDVTLGSRKLSRKLWQAFFTIFGQFIDQLINRRNNQPNNQRMQFQESDFFIWKEINK